MKVEELSEEQAAFYEDMGYRTLHKIDGEVVGLSQFLFTTGIVVGMDETGYKHRYCYHTVLDAHSALMEWIADGTEEPTDYITKK